MEQRLGIVHDQRGHRKYRRKRLENLLQAQADGQHIHRDGHHEDAPVPRAQGNGTVRAVQHNLLRPFWQGSGQFPAAGISSVTVIGGCMGGSGFSACAGCAAFGCGVSACAAALRLARSLRCL